MIINSSASTCTDRQTMNLSSHSVQLSPTQKSTVHYSCSFFLGQCHQCEILISNSCTDRQGLPNNEFTCLTVSVSLTDSQPQQSVQYSRSSFLILCSESNSCFFPSKTIPIHVTKPKIIKCKQHYCYIS